MSALSVTLAVYGTVWAARLGLEALNYRHQRAHGQKVPPGFQATVDPERLRRISAYTEDKIRLTVIKSFARSLWVGVFLFGGLLGAYDRAIAGVADSFVARGVVFFLGLMLVDALFELPFSLYSDFRVEARHGFNRKSPRLFFSDWLKSILLSLSLSTLLSAGALVLLSHAEHSWWLWVGTFFSVFSIALLFLSPTLIEPLFNKFEPLTGEALCARVEELARRAGVRVERILTVDASRRSAHSNAYFTGIGRVKRVVLFDTLLERMTHDEILAVLAHELGHWKRHHILLRLATTQLLSFGLLYAAFLLLNSDALPGLVGLAEASVPARFVVLLTLGSLLSFPLVPVFSAWSRRHERQADDFAIALRGKATDLASALLKLAQENLSNLHPHPWYAAYYYSHPPLAERLQRLGKPVAEVG